MVSVRSQDAVVLVPGIMGSRLVDATTREVMWGLNLEWYGKAWLRNKPWRDLEVTDDERSGRTDRVVADQLLRFGAFSPVLGGFAPYTSMSERLVRMLADPSALLEFPYDWRLPTTHNASLLADAVHRHLAAWRLHPAAIEAANRRPNGRRPQVVLIAHSMGGLVCRDMFAIPGAADDVRAVLTLGTPFRGAAKAAVTLATGEGAPFPLPRKRLRRMARTLPGLYDLLPVYRSVAEGTTVRRLTSADVAAIGANPELGEESRRRHTASAAITMRAHQTYVGGWQPTPSTLRIAAGELESFDHSYEVNADGTVVSDASGRPVEVERYGDGTVPLNSALPATGRAVTISQQHGSLAQVEEALSQASAILLEATSEPVFLGDTQLGLEVPDLLPLDGRAVRGRLTGHHAESAIVMVYDEQNILVDQPIVTLGDGQWSIDFTPSHAGVYRIEALAGGGGGVSQWVSVQDPADDEPDDESDAD